MSTIVDYKPWLVNQALQIMKLRNFVTNIMITENFRETRYQYNDHEGWGGNLVTNIMITNFFREIRYQDNDHEGFPRNVVIIS